MPDQNLYELLQVSPNADPEIIQAAYRRLVPRYHPDRSSEPNAAEMTQRLNDAYAILSDPTRRADYDRGLTGRPGSSTSGADQTGRPAPQKNPNRDATNAPPSKWLSDTSHNTRGPRRICPVCQNSILPEKASVWDEALGMLGCAGCLAVVGWVLLPAIVLIVAVVKLFNPTWFCPVCSSDVHNFVSDPSRRLSASRLIYQSYPNSPGSNQQLLERLVIVTGEISSINPVSSSLVLTGSDDGHPPHVSFNFPVGSPVPNLSMYSQGGEITVLGTVQSAQPERLILSGIRILHEFSSWTPPTT
jgi:hypothetical protein